EVDTLTGAVAPQPVPAISGGGTEDIRTTYATAGWDVAVKYDQTNVPVPAGVTATNCWSAADLHALMLTVRDPATNLDAEWHMHLVVVPAKMGCGRGVMYDTTGAPGVFPDNINLGFNTHVRHHLVHFPDIVVRPGGMTFGTGHSTTVPEADKNRHYFSEDEMELRLAVEHDQIHLGEPLQLSWELINNSATSLPAPTDIRIEAQHTLIGVVNPHGDSKAMSSFVIETEAANIAMLDAGKSLKADTRVFWSARSGFAFDTPGRYTIE